MNNPEQHCGVKPNFIEPFDPGNNPDFVFENDPNFETVVLYDVDGNIVNVNSWIECAHYVKGGWSNSTFNYFEGDKFLAFSLVIAISIYLLVKIYRSFFAK
jgi:hypothetical protein